MSFDIVFCLECFRWSPDASDKVVAEMDCVAQPTLLVATAENETVVV